MNQQIREEMGTQAIATGQLNRRGRIRRGGVGNDSMDNLASRVASKLEEGD